MSTTLTNLITATRDFLDEDSADRWSDALLTRYINQGLRQVQSQIENANGDYFLRVEVATALSGSYELALPSDIWGMRLRSLLFYDNSSVATGTPYRMEPAPLETIYKNLDSSGLPQFYSHHAGFIRWCPMLEHTGAFRFVYAMKETALSGGSDTIGQIADEHTDVIALYAAIMAKDRVGADSRNLKVMYDTRMQQITWDVQPPDPFRIPQVAID